MSELLTISRDDYDRLKERGERGTPDKSCLQLVMRLINRVSSVSDLGETVENILRNIIDVVGGSNIILYYWIDDDLYYADAFGVTEQPDDIADEQVRQVAASREPAEFEHPFGNTRLTTKEFGSAYTWVYPLLIGENLIGILKLENLHIGMRDLYEYLPAFFSFTALTLKNEILGYTRLKQAYERLDEVNAELMAEASERESAEEKFRTLASELEERVHQRTTELRDANERLQYELTERRHTEEELQSYAAEIEDLYNNAPCGYHSLDSNGVFVRINDTELTWLGYQRDELIGRKQLIDLMTPRSRALFLNNFSRFKQQGWIRDLEFELVRKDGTVLPVLLNATAVTDREGNYLMSRSTTFDITERKKNEEFEHLLSSIVESSDDAIIAKDMNEIILSWNRGAERIYGYTAEEAIGSPVSLVIPVERQSELPEIMARIKRGERIEHFTTERLRKDGGRIFVSLTISPIRDADGEVVRASIISRDITEQKQLSDAVSQQHLRQDELIRQRTTELTERSIELQDNQRALMNIVDDLNQKTAELEEANAKLKELDQLKSMFIASMSHELRTPLNSIIGFSSILHDEWLGTVNSEQKENLATILRSGKHLLSLINDVIDVSKIEAGKLNVRFEEFDLKNLMEEAAHYVEKDVREKGLELRLDTCSKTLVTDKRRLLQCIINLLTNAVKFTEQGNITLACSPVESGVEISVADTGIGIAATDMARLFQPFTRFDSPLKVTVPGTGLGLYLTRKLITEALEGDIVCTSLPGAGSTFTIRIPERLYEKSSGR